jgi:hypothetical protein
MGGTISLFVNASGTTGHTNTTVLGYLRGTTLVLGGGQVLLLDVTIGSELLGLPLVPGDLAIGGAPIPTAPALCGLTFHTQALHLGRVRPFALSNRHILTLGA